MLLTIHCMSSSVQQRPLLLKEVFKLHFFKLVTIVTKNLHAVKSHSFPELKKKQLCKLIASKKTK